ncbi:MAG: flagellar basal body P-ring formation protein FlgA [Planctomycetes bacterium]|nr:flagellar basal body P-ring formation protein FlgA [Planctomycetota bacterium]
MKYACLCLWFVCSAVSAVETIQLLEQIEIPRAQVYLSDIATTTMEHQQWNNISIIPIQRLAGAGPYTITARRILTILRNKGLKGEVIIRGSVAVTRKIEVIDAQSLFAKAKDDMLQRIANHHQWQDVEITQKRAAKEISVFAQEDNSVLSDLSAQSAQRLVAEPLTQNMFGEVPYRICAMENKRELARSLLVLEVRARREVAVVQRDLPKGHVLNYGDISSESILVGARRQQEAPKIDAVVGKVLRQARSRGTVLYPMDVREPYAVHGGQTVDILYVRNGFQLTIRGVAQGTASIGEGVKVRGVDGGRMIIARVIGKDLVQID